MSLAPARPRRGPVQAAERALAPDLARGLMLLLIVLANTPWYLYGSQPGLSSVHPVDGSRADQVVQAVIITTVDMRVYPMFAFLFGYGIVQLYRRQIAAGTEDRTARRILRRRHWWLIAFGFVDAALLWMGDVLAAYGLAGLIMVALFFRRRDRTLLIWAGVGTALLTLGMIFAVVGSFFAAQAVMSGEPSSFFEPALAVAAQPNYLASIPMRLLVWAILTPLQGILFLVVPIVMLLSFWAARRQILEHPGDHLRLLRRVAVIGIAIGWLGGLPHALDHVGVLPVPDQVAWVFSATQGLTGMCAGVGYVAAFGLLAHRISTDSASRSGVPGELSTPVQAITAVGRRSLSCYLAQSIICAPILSAWGLGLGAVLGSATTALFAIGVWLLTVIAAYLLERRGARGPAEVVLRRLVYPKSAS